MKQAINAKVLESIVQISDLNRGGAANVIDTIIYLIILVKNMAKKYLFQLLGCRLSYAMGYCC